MTLNPGSSLAPHWKKKLLYNAPGLRADVIYDPIATDRIIDWLFGVASGSVRAPVSKPGYGEWNQPLNLCLLEFIMKQKPVKEKEKA